MPSAVVRILNISLFAVCSFQTAGITNDVIRARLYTPASRAVTADAAEAPAAAAWETRQPILDRNVFGAQLAGDTPVEAVVIEEDVAETKLPLQLEATIAATGKSSRASIYDTRARKSEVLRPGDELEGHPQVKIERIERGRVLLLNNGKREELLLAEATNSPSRVTPAASPSTRRPSRDTRSSPDTRASRESRRTSGRKRSGSTAREAAARSRKSGGVDPEYAEMMEDLRARMDAGEITLSDFDAEMRGLRDQRE